MKIRILLLIGVVLTLINHSNAQTHNVNTIKRLEIGDALTEIAFTHKSNFSSWLKSTKDLKGKLVLLDFWGLGCASCVESFPKMDSLQKEFGDKIQIILVNSSSEEKKCLDYISKLRDEKMKKAFASIPSINGDTRWETLFPHHSVPHHVWIDQEGKIIAISQDHNTTRKNIKAILSGAKLKFAVKDDLVEYDYFKKGIMRQGNEKLSSPILYSAFLPPFNGLGSGTLTYIDSTESSIRVIYRNLSASMLYFLVDKKIRSVVETKKVSGRYDSKPTDKWQEENLFIYEIKVPLSQKQSIPKYMLEDLNRFFGMKYNIVGAIETRSVPAFILKKISSLNALNQVKKETSSTSMVDTEHIITLTGLKAHFRSYENIDQNKIFIDETGISPKDKLDISLPLDVSNLSTINIALKVYGLELVKDVRQIKLMVVKDK